METCSTEIIKKKLIPMTIKEHNITGTKYPRLVLSIIGDSRTFVPKPWLTPVFQLGLIETAKGANDCLILYEGSEEKISTLVREAVQNFRVLKKDDDKTFISFVRIRSPLFEEETGCNAVQNMDKEDEICFTLKGDDYVELLSNISREYVPLVELGQDNNLKMPVLVIVAEGESATIELVVNLVECCIPVLVLKGSGKAADLIADCLDDSSAINLKASLLLGTFIHSGEMAVLKNHMRKIRKKKQFVNVLDISTQDETQFPEAVSNAIIRAWAQGGTDKPVISDNTDLMKVKTTEPDKIYESTRNGNQDVPEVISPTEMSDGTFLPALNIGSENYNVDTSDAFDNSLNNKPGCSSVVKPNDKSRKNRINPKSVTLHNAKMGGEVKQFMTKYQESLTPASLPLYFYIAYQFIQEMSNKDDKRQNFQIL